MLYQSPAQVAETIGKSRRWVIARCLENKLPFIRENGRYLIDTDKLEEALLAMEAAAIKEAGGFFPHQANQLITSRYRL